MLNNQALGRMASDADLFERVVSRMTGTEMVTVLEDRGLIASSSVPNITVPDGMPAEGVLSYLHANLGRGGFFSTSPYKWSGGILLSNRRPDEVRTLLKDGFNADRAGFLSVFSDERAQELVTAQARYGSLAFSQEAKSNIFIWQKTEWADVLAIDATLDDRGNCIVPIDCNYTDTSGSPPSAATIGALLLAQPEGRRYLRTHNSNVRFWGIYDANAVGTYLSSTNTGVAVKYPIFDAPRTHATRKGFSMEWYRTEMAKTTSAVAVFAAALRVYGEAQLGPGNGHKILDGYCIDVEEGRSSYHLLLPQFTGDTITAAMSDSTWETMRKNHLWPINMPDAYWTAVAALAYNVGPYGDERCFLLDASLDYYYRNSLALFFSHFEREFSDKPGGLNLHSYHDGRHAPGTISERSSAQNPVIGTGARVGTSSVSVYGGVEGTYANRWYWPTRSVQTLSGSNSTEEQNFGAFVEAISELHGALAADNGRINVWLAYQAVADESTITNCTLTTRTDNDTATVTITGTNGYANGQTVDVGWAAGQRLGMTISSLSGSGAGATMVVDGGTGDNLPVQTTALFIRRNTLQKMGYDGLYKELVLHAALLFGDQTLHPRGGVNFYNSGIYHAGGGYEALYALFLNLIKERDAIVGPSDGFPIPRTGVTSLLPPFMVSSFASAGRIIHRVTQNPEHELTINGYDVIDPITSDIRGARVVYSNALGSLTFRNAVVPILLPTTFDNQTALGSWVIEYPEADPDDLLLPSSFNQAIPSGVF